VTLPSGLPVVDHHCHLSPGGEGVAAARRFAAEGGTHLFLATQNYTDSVPRSLEEYQRQFETTEHLAGRVRVEAEVEVYPVIAPYPIDLLTAAETLGVAEALELHRRALDLAGRWVRERRAVALGEVGLPHFPVSGELREAGEAAFDHALVVAREVGCPVVVHCADLDLEGYRALAARGLRAGVPDHRIVKHYARALRPPGAPASIVPSYLAKRELVASALTETGPWFLETDFLDDPARPGAVLDLATVPKRARAIADQTPELVDRLTVPFVSSVEQVYGWRPEVRRGSSA
jgi:TatD-related deoxyribonuclease